MCVLGSLILAVGLATGCKEEKPNGSAGDGSAEVSLSPTVYAQKPPTLPEPDRIRIAEAFRLADALGNRVWPDWDKASFAILLVTPEQEFLIRHPKPSGDFTLIGEDAVLKHKVWFRKRKYGPDLLATFPAVGGVPTVVIGQAENTAAKTSTRWVITLLHEHFHQLQNSQPRYYAEVDALGLARGDQTGMWMLNYAFPSTTPEVKDQFSVMCKALAEALRARQQADFAKKLASYVEAKKKFQSLLKADDYKYFAFQAWQEGIARYTEYHIAVLAAAEYKPSKEFEDLKDYAPFKEEARAILKGIEKELASVELDKAKRTAFYGLGAAEGLVLDRANPGWRKHYFEEKFSLDKHFRSEK
jgi:hypothetical protein